MCGNGYAGAKRLKVERLSSVVPDEHVGTVHFRVASLQSGMDVVLVVTQVIPR